jgi:tight adherence protein B
MGAVVGLCFGVGAFLVWWSCWAPPRGDTPVTSLRDRLPERLQDVLTQAGLRGVAPGPLLLTAAGLGALVGLGTVTVSQSPPIAVSFGLLAAWTPVLLIRLRAHQRRVVLRELWPEVVDNLSSGIRAGLSLPEALAQLAERGPEPLRGAFAAFGRDYHATGRFGEALDNLKDRLADPVADRICEALRITREVGGSDLGRLLRSLSAYLREDARTRAEVQARQSWTVNAARLAVAAPWAVLGMLATRPESVRPYNTPAGAAVLAVGALLSLVAYRLMLMLARLPEERRVLR